MLTELFATVMSVVLPVAIPIIVIGLLARSCYTTT